MTGEPGEGGNMNKKEADDLLHSVDKQTLDTAKKLMLRLLPAMKGGKWDTMSQPQKVCILVAIALQYGRRQGQAAANE